MLKTNLWTKFGLVNRSMGCIDDLSLDFGHETSQLPSVILIRFDNYTRPIFLGY